MLANWRIRQVDRVLHAGGVIAYPTEAVWGLGCNPWKADAVERLLPVGLPVEGLEIGDAVIRGVE